MSQTAFELGKQKENSGRQQLSGAPHATHAKSMDKHVRQELDCTPTLARINTDYDPGSIVSTAQSNMQVCTLLQTDSHASTSPLSFFTGRMPFLPPNQQCQSTEGICNKLLKLKYQNHVTSEQLVCNKWG